MTIAGIPLLFSYFTMDFKHTRFNSLDLFLDFVKKQLMPIDYGLKISWRKYKIKPWICWRNYETEYIYIVLARLGYSLWKPTHKYVIKSDGQYFEKILHVYIEWGHHVLQSQWLEWVLFLNYETCAKWSCMYSLY